MVEGQHREDAPQHEEERRAGRMRHPEGIGTGDELAAVPERGGRRHGGDVQDQGKNKHGGGDTLVNPGVGRSNGLVSGLQTHNCAP